MLLTWWKSLFPCKEDVIASQQQLLLQNNLKSNWVRTDGLRIHTVNNNAFAAARCGQSIYVCIHGTGSSTVTFIPFLKKLDALGLPGLAIDLPGYGISDAFRESTICGSRMDAYIRLVHEVLQLTLVQNSIIWVGHSLGSVIASWCAIYKPEATHAVVLLSPPGISSFRYRCWERLIKWGIPEATLTKPYVSWLTRPILWMRHYLRSEYLFQCLFLLNPDRQYSSSLLASFLRWCHKTSSYVWLYPYVSHLAHICHQANLHIIWGKLDPILLPPRDGFQIPSNIKQHVVPYAWHNPINEDDAVSILLSLANYG